MNISFDLSNQLVSDTIISGIEGGIQYWCSNVIIKTKDRFSVVFREADGGELFEFTSQDWPRAIAQMATTTPYHFANMIAGRGDATTGDILIQLACFQEIKYG